MGNLASIFPQSALTIAGSGRSGLKGSSKLDRKVWEAFHADWEGLALECDPPRRNIDAVRTETAVEDAPEGEDFTGATRWTLTEQRIRQQFFRRTVLSGYRGRCCMSGVADAQLLVASHVVPWCADKANRLNPSNGLCLSEIHDRAFDKRMIWLTDDFRLSLSQRLVRSPDAFVQSVFSGLEGKKIELSERFAPSVAFVARHRQA